MFLRSRYSKRCARRSFRNRSTFMINRTRTTQQILIGAAILFLVIAFAPAGAQTRPQQPKIQTPAQTGGEPNASPSILVSPDQDYRIGARDVIEIRVDDAPEL